MRTIALVASLAALAACSSIGTYVEPAAGSEAATVLGESRSVFAGINPLGQSADIRILAIDGMSLSKSGRTGFPDVVRVTPGSHELTVLGSLMVDGQNLPSFQGKVRAECAAGRVYKLRITAFRQREGEFAVDPVPVQ